MSNLGKRDRAEFEQDQTEARHFGVAETISRLKDESSTVNGVTEQIAAAKDTTLNGDKDVDGGWQVADGKKHRKKKSKREEHGGYPELTHSPHARLQTQVRISDLQTLVLYLLADGPSPQWIAVKHHKAIRKVVVLMVPGLERDMFFGDMLTKSAAVASHDQAVDSQDRSLTTRENYAVSPDDYYPVRLHKDSLPSELQPMANMFTHLWPVKAPGDSKLNRLHSPLQAMLSCPLPKNQDEKEQKGPRPPRESRNWEDKTTAVTEYVTSVDDLRDAEYTLHPALLVNNAEKDAEIARRKAAAQTPEDGWVDSRVSEKDIESQPIHSKSKGMTGGKKVLAIDCEMCMAGSTFVLTRISVIDWSDAVIFDELVKPSVPITDYLTAYSGITAEKLEPVTTTLSDIQTRLLTLLANDTILIGHSLNSDLAALKLTHPHIVDTSLLYPHPRGPPLKSSLKWLAQKYLSRDIQKTGHGASQGHDSIEDARTALDLVKLKCQRGPSWGTHDATTESIFKRISRMPKPSQSQGQHVSPTTTTTHTPNNNTCTTAIVDWGFPKRGYGANADACIGCASDAAVVEGVTRAVSGDAHDREIPRPGVEFVWARMRELEAVRGWWSSSKTSDNDALRDSVTNVNPASTIDESSPSTTSTSTSSPLRTSVAATTAHITAIHASLPPCTALIVYSGTGDPRAYTRLLAAQQQYKREYNTKKWSEIEVHWGEAEESAMRAAVKEARTGVAFVCVKSVGASDVRAGLVE